MGDGQMLRERFRQAVESGGLDAMSRMIMDVTTDDFVEEWPQSGERIRGRDAARRIAEQYEGATGTTPRMTLRRMLGDDEISIIEGTIDYGDGTPVSYIGIAEVRDGLVARLTEYFANPFEPPAWRAAMVERMEAQRL